MVITLTTDFGAGSPYVAAMKGVILSLSPTAQIVDISHSIPPQDVREGALVLAAATHWFPAGTVHLAVVDPDVGTDRRIVYARIEDQHYVAPDNGLLSRIATRWRPSTIISVESREYWLPHVSATFHGRDIMAPVAAQLGLGLDPRQLGPRINQLISLPWSRPTVEEGRIAGCVEAIDSFGNLITDIGAELLPAAASAERVRVSSCGRVAEGLSQTYGERPEDSFVALIGSGGSLEVALVRGNAAQMLDAGVGTPVEVTWTKKKAE